ncbi:kinase-like domain-containing protein [Crucibulum laeve]|uniref:Kinase-like domain-containing protein n=1 Tax=Crucibulum laeve TaxID=68775 RepID=A0A5C3M3N7_9AGAR|nr:kinase-like domain-containing protein [Crucibulum laeve]
MTPLNAGRFLDKIKKEFSTKDQEIYRQLLHSIQELISKDESQDRQIVESIKHTACLLKQSPRLFHDLNILLDDGYRIECCTTGVHVELYVLVTPSSTEIHSTVAGRPVPRPASAQELRAKVSIDGIYDDFASSDDVAWLTCISQLLQLELDDSSINRQYRRKALRYMRELSLRSILPPSFFLNDIDCLSGFALSGGSFADIFEGRLADLPVCLKVLRTFSTPGHREREFAREALIWRQLRHPNVLRFLGATEELFANRFCLISPWMPNGNIMTFLEGNPHHDRFTSICEIVEGVRYLHGLDPPVTHKDIKGANILVTNDLVCCLADFGFSAVMESQSQFLSGSPALQGSMCWMAPEVMDCERVSRPGLPADIFSLACTIYEIYTGLPPFADSENGAVVILAVLRGERAKLPPKRRHWTTQEEEIWTLVDNCWEKEPGKRPTISYMFKTLQDIDRSILREPQTRPVSMAFPGEEMFTLNISPNTSRRKDRVQLKDWLSNEITQWTATREPSPSTQLSHSESCEPVQQSLLESSSPTRSPLSDVKNLHLVESFDRSFSPQEKALPKLPTSAPASVTFIDGLATPLTPSFKDLDVCAQPGKMLHRQTLGKSKRPRLKLQTPPDSPLVEAKNRRSLDKRSQTPRSPLIQSSVPFDY